MKKIQDRIFLGIVTGLIASIPGRVINKIEYTLGYTDLKYEENASSIFIPKKIINKPTGRVIGFVANTTLTCIAGIMTSYILSATGKDKAITKSLGIKLLFWSVFEGLVPKAGLSRKSKKPLAPLLSLLDHIIFGIGCGTIALKLGDYSLFPDNNLKKGEKLPLFSTNNYQIPETNDLSTDLYTYR